MTSTILREIKGSSSLFSFFEVYLLKTMERREEEHSWYPQEYHMSVA
jgi:hypothetical protein